MGNLPLVARAAPWVAAILACAGCSDIGGEAKEAQTGPSAAELISTADQRVCAHPDVVQTLTDLLKRPTGQEQTMLPMTQGDIAKLTLPDIGISRIAASAIDQSVNRVTCSAVVTVEITGTGGPDQTVEQTITYEVSPALDDPDSFLVSASTSLTADLINLAILREINSAVTAEREAADAGSVPTATPSSDAAADGPSFDCSKAGNYVERTICADDKLSALDRELSFRYDNWVARIRSGSMIDPLDEVVAEQKAWLRDRNSCDTKVCIDEAYARRLAELPQA